jgi:hypothetical protein
MTGTRTARGMAFAGSESRRFAVASAIWMRVCCALVALAACGCDRTMSERAIQYNHQVEQVENDELLLNVVRASFGHPLYFTDFSDIHSPAPSSFGLGGTVPVAVTGQTGVSLVPNFQVYENYAQFGVGVLNSSDFIRGISTPVGVQTVDMFTQQRYSSLEQLLSLFVGRIDTAGGDVVTNNPRDSTQAVRFQNLLRLLIALGLRTETVEDHVGLGPDMPADQVRPIDHAQVLSQPDIELVRTSENPPRFRLEQIRRSQRFCFSSPPILAPLAFVAPAAREAFAQRIIAITCRSWISANLDRPSEDNLAPEARNTLEIKRFLALHTGLGDTAQAQLAGFAEEKLPGLILGLRPDEAVPPSKGETHGQPSGPQPPTNVHALDLGPVTLYLRSPGQMLAYLGEIATMQTRDRSDDQPKPQKMIPGPRFLSDQSYDRVRRGDCPLPGAEAPDAVPPLCSDVRQKLLFRVLKDDAKSRPTRLAAVDYLGHSYSVLTGDDPAGVRSGETLSTLSILLSLYRSSSDLPRTTPVRSIPDRRRWAGPIRFVRRPEGAAAGQQGVGGTNQRRQAR